MAAGRNNIGHFIKAMIYRGGAANLIDQPGFFLMKNVIANRFKKCSRHRPVGAAQSPAI